jgi:hypothetical protein
MARPATPPGVVTARAPLLLAVADHHRGVHVQGHPLQCTELAEQPAVAFRPHALIGEHVETAKPPQDGLVTGRLRPADQSDQRAVHTHRLGMREPAGTTPDRHDELLDQLHRFIAPVGTRRRQTPPPNSTLSDSLQRCHRPSGVGCLGLLAQAMALGDDGGQVFGGQLATG